MSGGRRPLLQGRPLLARLAFAPGQPRRLCCRCSLQTSTKGRKPPPWQRARAPPQSQLFADGQRRLCLLYAAPGSPLSSRPRPRGPAGSPEKRQSTLLRSDNSHSNTNLKRSASASKMPRPCTAVTDVDAARARGCTRAGAAPSYLVRGRCGVSATPGGATFVGSAHLAAQRFLERGAASACAARPPWPRLRAWPVCAAPRGPARHSSGPAAPRAWPSAARARVYNALTIQPTHD